MRFLITFAFLLLWLWIGTFGTVTARAEDAMPLAAIPAGFELAGSWDCAGKFRGGKVHKAKFEGGVILDGKWLELTERDVEPATGYMAKYLIGYDSQQHQLVEFDANNFGAATYASKDGWKDRVLTMTSGLSTDAKAPFVANRFVYALSASGTFTVDWEISRSIPLQWIGADHLACSRHVERAP